MFVRLFARWQRKASSCRKLPRRRALVLEPLEERTLLSAVNWINPGSGNWDVPANWNGGSVPGSGDDVIINTAAPATILIQTGDTEQVNSLTTAANDTLSLTG